MVKGLVQGVGINDADYQVRTLDNETRKRWMCPFYSKWSDMLKRCYSVKHLKAQPSYKDCFVCEDWLTFSNFKRWMKHKIGEEITLTRTC